MSAVPSGRLLPVLAALVTALLVLSFGFTEMMGSDLWWHLAAGREILAQGTVWLEDSWSYTATGTDWNNHEWLADLCYHAWASAFGVPSLVYWKWLLLVLAYGCLQLTLYRQTGDALASLLATGLAVAVAAPFLDIRPQLYTLLGFCLLLLLTLERRPRAWQLVLLFLFWVNLHAGFIFGLMALVILLFPWRRPDRASIVQALRVAAPSAATCLLNPAGIDVFLLPLQYALDSGSPYRQLGEWLSPLRAGGIAAPLFFPALWLLPLLLLYALPRLRRQGPQPWGPLLLCALTLAMALTSRRFIPLFAIALALVTAPLLALLSRRLPARRASLPLALLLLAALALQRLAIYPLAAAPAYHYLTAEYSYPRDMLDRLLAEGVRGKVFAYYNWGGYLHWRSAGRLQVFIDGRANTVFDDATYRRYVGVLRHQPGWIDSVEGSGAQWFLWPARAGGGARKARELLATGRWQLVYQDAVSYLLARRELAWTGSLPVDPALPLASLTLAHTAMRNGQWLQAVQATTALRQQRPWERDACNWQVLAYQQLGQAGAALRTAVECRSIFPSKYLR